MAGVPCFHQGLAVVARCSSSCPPHSVKEALHRLCSGEAVQLGLDPESNGCQFISFGSAFGPTLFEYKSLLTVDCVVNVAIECSNPLGQGVILVS